MRDHLVDRVVREPALGEVLVDLPLAVGLAEGQPARDRTADRLSRAPHLATRLPTARHQLDHLARDTLLEQLADDGPLPLWPELVPLLDPVPGEGLVVDVALRPQLVDGLIYRGVI